MYGFSQKAISRNANPACVESSGDKHWKARIAVRQFFQPGVLAFFTLALAVGGWAYANKLSHYYHLNSVAKASSPRIWVDHRDPVSDAEVHHGAHGKIVAAELLAALVSVPQNPESTAWFIANVPNATSFAFHSSSLVPFRAPPILDSSLA